MESGEMCREDQAKPALLTRFLLCGSEVQCLLRYALFRLRKASRLRLPPAGQAAVTGSLIDVSKSRIQLFGV